MLTKLTKHTLLFLVALSSLQLAKAQQWLGRTTGNYSGTYGVYSNASSIADNKYKYYFNFWGRGLNFYNNYLSYNAPIKINHWANNNYDLQYRNIDGNVNYQKNWLLENWNGKNKQFSFTQDIFGPAFMFPVSKNWNMSINTRQRTGFQWFGIDESVAKLAFGAKMDSTKYASIDNKFGINIQSYQELGFTLGGIMAKGKRGQLNGGATLKFIRGLGAAYLKGESLNIIGTGTNSAKISGDLQYAYNDDKTIVDPINNPYGGFGLNSRGLGVGVDLGLTYTYRSERGKYSNNQKCDLNDRRSDHDFKLALAINDLGGIRYNRMSTKYTYSAGQYTNVSVSKDILDAFHAPNQNAMDTIGTNVFGQMGATKSYSYSTALPSAVNLQMDFRISKHLYTALFWNQSLKGYNSTGIRSTSLLSVIPRFESRGFEFSMPLTLSENYRNFYVGAYTRIGPVFFGSDNLGGLLNVASNGQFTGADIYGGISMGIGHCARFWSDGQVDPVYLDSTDSLRTELRDSNLYVKRDTIVKTDTVKIVKNDTIYINKTVTNKALLEKEKELKRKEDELNKKKTELEIREKDLATKEKTTDNTDLNNCRNNVIILTKENTTLKDKNRTQNDALVNSNKRISELEQELAKCKAGNKTVNDATLQKKVDSLGVVLEKTRMEYELCKRTTGNKTNNEAALQRKIDSLSVIIVQTRTEYENCKKNSVQNNAEILKKTEAQKKKAENDAMLANRRADSLLNILNIRVLELDRCKKSSVMTNDEVVKKAEQDRAKAENDARVARRQADSLKLLLTQKENELLNCKKNSIQYDPEYVKNLETGKSKAENDAKVARKQSDSLTLILGQKMIELDNCKKNSTQNNAEVVKKLEAEKAKAQNDATVAKKQADSLTVVVGKLAAELEACKKNSSNTTDAQKLKQCEDNSALLKAEMTEMTKTINRLNTKNYELSNRVDSLSNALKNCCKNCGTGGGENDALLKKCQDDNATLTAQITQLKATIAARDKSLDSMKTVVTDLNKKKTELDAQIVKLNSDISELKAKGSDCSDLQKQLDAKTEEANKLKTENNTLQNQVKTLNAQLNEYKTEYNFMVKQNQKCNAQLDSCKRGLYNVEPTNDGGSGNGGPTPPIDHGSNNSNDDVYGTAPAGKKTTETSSSPSNNSNKSRKGVELGVKILGTIIENSVNNSGNTSSGSSSPAPKTGKNTTESTGGTSGTSTTTTTSKTNTGSATNTGNTKPSGAAPSNGSTTGKAGSGANTNGSSGTSNSGSSGAGAGTPTSGDDR